MRNKAYSIKLRHNLSVVLASEMFNRQQFSKNLADSSGVDEGKILRTIAGLNDNLNDIEEVCNALGFDIIGLQLRDKDGKTRHISALKKDNSRV